MGDFKLNMQRLGGKVTSHCVFILYFRYLNYVIGLPNIKSKVF